MSSSSVYGVKDEEQVTEDLPLEPLTDYSRFKAECEDVLLDAREEGFAVTVIRPATVCGASTRQRMDLTVNILTNHAVNAGVIRVFGGDQFRPNRSGEPVITFAHTSRIMERLGWGPEVDFETGVANVVERIEDWRDAPIWEPKSIAEATRDWSTYLGDRD